MDSGSLRGGGPSRSPFWRTPEESCKGLGSVSLKNKNSTHTGGQWKQKESGAGDERYNLDIVDLESLEILITDSVMAVRILTLWRYGY
jgi:hypothetical protein